MKAGSCAGDALRYTVGLNVGFNDKLCHTHMLFFCNKHLQMQYPEADPKSEALRHSSVWRAQ